MADSNKIISLANLETFKGLVDTELAKKYETITYDSTTRVISFYKSADTTKTADFTITLPEGVDISGKADKAVPAAANNIAVLNATGNLVDGGKGIAALEVTVEKQATAETGYAATYVVKQGSTQVGDKINIPKDWVLKNVELKTCTKADEPEAGYVIGDKYFDFSFNTKDASETVTHVYLKVNELVDVYTAATGATEVQVAIDSSTNVVSATLVDGGVAEAKIAADAVTTAKIKDANVTADKLAADSVATAKIVDKNVTLAKLADSVQTSLGKADSSIQSIATGTANGNISVDGTDVAVKGLADGAYSGFATTEEITALFS